MPSRARASAKASLTANDTRSRASGLRPIHVAPLCRIAQELLRAVPWRRRWLRRAAVFTARPHREERDAIAPRDRVGPQRGRLRPQVARHLERQHPDVGIQAARQGGLDAASRGVQRGRVDALRLPRRVEALEPGRHEHRELRRVGPPERRRLRRDQLERPQEDERREALVAEQGLAEQHRRRRGPHRQARGPDLGRGEHLHGAHAEGVRDGRGQPRHRSVRGQRARFQPAQVDGRCDVERVARLAQQRTERGREDFRRHEVVEARVEGSLARPSQLRPPAFVRSQHGLRDVRRVLLPSQLEHRGEDPERSRREPPRRQPAPRVGPCPIEQDVHGRCLVMAQVELGQRPEQPDVLRELAPREPIPASAPRAACRAPSPRGSPRARRRGAASPLDPGPSR